MLQSVAVPPGTGKSHFVEALAHTVIEAGMRVSWFTLESLTATMGRAEGGSHRLSEAVAGKGVVPLG